MSWEEVRVAPALLLAPADTMRSEFHLVKSCTTSTRRQVLETGRLITRRVLFRLVLPFERQIKGEEDRPLPPSKPRKLYKRILEHKRILERKVTKAEKKRKGTQSDREMDSETEVTHFI